MLGVLEGVLPRRIAGQVLGYDPHLQGGQTRIEVVQVDHIGLAISLVAADQVAVRGLLSPLDDVAQSFEVQPPQRLQVAAMKRQCLRALLGCRLLVRHDGGDGLIDASRSSARFSPRYCRFEQVGQGEVGFEIVGHGLSDAQPSPARSDIVRQLPLRLADRPQGRPLKAHPGYFRRQEAQPAGGLGGRGARHLLGEICGHNLHRRGIELGQCRQHLEDRTVGLALTSQRRPNDIDKFVLLFPGLVDVVLEIAIGQDIERRRVRHRRALNQDGSLLPQGVPDPELIKDVGVVDRDVAQDEIGLDDQAEHVFANVTGVYDLSGSSPAEFLPPREPGQSAPDGCARSQLLCQRSSSC